MRSAGGQGDFVSPIRGTPATRSTRRLRARRQNLEMLDTAGHSPSPQCSYGPEILRHHPAAIKGGGTQRCLCAGDRSPSTAQSPKQASARCRRASRKTAAPARGGGQQVGRHRKDSHTMPAWEKELRAKLDFLGIGPPIACSPPPSAASGGATINLALALAGRWSSTRVGVNHLGGERSAGQEALKAGAPPHQPAAGAPGRPLTTRHPGGHRPPAITLVRDGLRKLSVKPTGVMWNAKIAKALGFDGSTESSCSGRGKQERDSCRRSSNRSRPAPPPRPISVPIPVFLGPLTGAIPRLVQPLIWMI